LWKLCTKSWHNGWAQLVWDIHGSLQSTVKPKNMQSKS
jgi:hypothetical protein